jgi:hypothetical protein
MSERETPSCDALAKTLQGESRIPWEVKARTYERENARLKEELEAAREACFSEGRRGDNHEEMRQRERAARLAAESRVSELEAKLADVSEHAAYEQRRAEGAVAELVEVHAKLAETERKYLDAWRESQVERGLAVRAEQALAQARKEALEEAAKICDEVARDWMSSSHEDRMATAMQCAAAIRAW